MIAAETAGARLVETQALVVRLGGRLVLDSVDLAVDAGEIVSLIGPNGCGKTTLVRAVLGLVPTQAGKVYRRPGLVVGYMPQRVTLDPVMPLTVRRFLGLAGAGVGARIDAALEEVGAAGTARRPVQDLSGGELQRVLLARALLREPGLLVLDEPVQGVDISGQRELFDLITFVRDRRGCGVLMVSHDLHLVMAATDIVVCLNHHVCCTGRPEAVSRDPAYLDLFGPRAAAGLAVYTHDHDHHHGPSGEVRPAPHPKPPPRSESDG